MLSDGERLPIVQGDGQAVTMVGVATGSHYRSINRIELEPGGETLPISHPSEAVYFVAGGRALLEDGPQRHELRRGMILLLPGGRPYRFIAQGAVRLYGGPCPPGPDPAGSSDGGEAGGSARIFDGERDGVPLPMISRQARLVVWPGIGAEVATMNFVVLEPGEENQPHSHPESEDTIVIVEGRGSVDDLATDRTLLFEAGDVVHIKAGVPHKVKADRGTRIVSVGGPCPPDLHMLRACGLID